MIDGCNNLLRRVGDMMAPRSMCPLFWREDLDSNSGSQVAIRELKWHSWRQIGGPGRRTSISDWFPKSWFPNTMGSDKYESKVSWHIYSPINRNVETVGLWPRVNSEGKCGSGKIFTIHKTPPFTALVRPLLRHLVWRLEDWSLKFKFD